MISKKVILVGDFATGKTSLIRRFVDNQFSDTYLSTIGVKISKKKLTLANGIEVQCMIWDIEGGTQSKPVNTTYFTGTHGAFLVADITREETINHLSDYLAILKEKYPGVPVIIALNKSDKLPLEDAKNRVDKVAEAYKGDIITTILTSAKTGEGVEEMFYSMAEAMTAG